MQKYRPSNGTEGDYFIAEHCAQCRHEKFLHTQDHADMKCEILSRTMLHGVTDPEYPREWVYIDDKPTCTSFARWDWYDGEGCEPPPDDPSQLVLPFIIEELELV